MSEVAVEMRDVAYVYPSGNIALENVNLRVMKGERVAILGPNGAGKSTLLMLMNGLYIPSKGQISLLGLPLNKNNLHKVRMKVGLAFQDPNDQLFCPTLWEDVTFGPSNMGLSEREIVKRAEGALKAVGLEGYEEKPPHHLSVGEKKKAAIATVLAMKPEILILDEPTANLDPHSRAELMKLIERLHKKSKITLIIASHDVNFVPMVADRVYVLNKGKIVAEGPIRDVFSDFKIMKEANLEPPIIMQLFNLLNDLTQVKITLLPLTIEEALSEIKCRIKTTLTQN